MPTICFYSYSFFLINIVIASLFYWLIYVCVCYCCLSRALLFPFQSHSNKPLAGHIVICVLELLYYRRKTEKPLHNYACLSLLLSHWRSHFVDGECRKTIPYSFSRVAAAQLGIALHLSFVAYKCINPKVVLEWSAIKNIQAHIWLNATENYF